MLGRIRRAFAAYQSGRISIDTLDAIIARVDRDATAKEY